MSDSINRRTFVSNTLKAGALAGLERRTGWQRRRVDINISTVVSGQEAKALVRVEPLDLAARHRVLLARNRVPGYPAGEPGAVGNSLRR